MSSSSMLKSRNKVKEARTKKLCCLLKEEQKIVETFIKKEAVEDFSVTVSYEDIKEKNYSLSAGQYFDIKIDYVDITAEEFEAKMTAFQCKLSDLFQQSHALEREIEEQMKGLKYE